MKIKIAIIGLLLLLAGCSSSKSNASKDGSSMENAIRVGDVSEEYSIVRKLCPDCKMKSQSLISNTKGTKYYDVLTLTKPDGTEVEYYFDINSFYGKW